MFQSKCVRLTVRGKSLKKSHSTLVIKDQTTDGKWEEKSRSSEANNKEPLYSSQTDVWTRAADRMLEFSLSSSGKTFAYTQVCTPRSDFVIKIV